MNTKELKKYPFQILVMVISFFLAMTIPMLLSYLVDNIIIAGDYKNLTTWCISAFLLAIFSAFMNFTFTNYFPIKIGITNSFKLQQKTMKDILNMNQSVYCQKDKGYYYNLTTNSCSAYGDLHEEIHLNLISNIIYLLGILALVTYYSKIFGIFFLLYGIVLVVISLKGAAPLFSMQKDVLERQDNFFDSLRNIIENKAAINAIHSENFFENRSAASITAYKKHILRYRFWDYLCQYLPTAANQIFSILFLFLAAMLVKNNQITVGILLMGYQYLGYFATPISTICSILMRYKSNKVHIERVDTLSKDACLPKENENVQLEKDSLFKTQGFNFYKYNNTEKDLLFHSDKLELHKNCLYVIKGKNGSGKSMFLNMLLGNIDKKYLNGAFTLAEHLKDNTTFLTYPIFTVNGSFKENLFGIRQNEQLIKMLHVDFNEKEITSNPINLSYGQQQKLALLRVLGSNSDILFLDEPLSNLDTMTQEKLINYIVNLKGQKTVLVVMHSCELDAYADGIIQISDQKLRLT